MSALSDSLEQLFKFLERRGQSPPTQDVRVFEIDPRSKPDSEGRLRILSSQLQEPQEYEARFEELITAGLPWINISCYGVHKKLLLVGVEIPAKSPTSIRPRLSSLNYSGPQRSVLDNGWEAAQIISIV